ncbi:MAG: FMN-binding protein [Erysipelotrichaceae bacterium]
MKKLLAVLLVLSALSLTACGGSDDSTTGAEAIYNAGVQEVTVAGHNGDIVVEVTFTETAIESIEATAHVETDGIATPALTTLVDTMIAEQSADVDAISSCTVTSEAMKLAVSQAIDAATK